MRCPRHFHELLFKKRKIIREWHKEKKKKHLEPSMEEKTKKKKKKRSKETERSGGSKCKAKPTHL